MDRAQSRAPIQTLEDARDSVTTVCLNPTEIITGSVDGHVRAYDLRKGQLRSDYIGRNVISHSFACCAMLTCFGRRSCDLGSTNEGRVNVPRRYPRLVHSSA
jgi:hypothetical protein